MNNKICQFNVFIFGLLLLFASQVYALDTGVESLRQTSKAFSSVAKKVSPSVVFIKVEGKAQSESLPFSLPFGEQSPFGDDFFKRFFGEQFKGFAQPQQPKSPSRERKVMGQGSGFVFKTDRQLVSKTAYILTNHHVVENAEKISVTFDDGREYDAEITGSDPQSDVAVIEIKASDVPALTVADSSELDVGEWVVALGSPFGLNHTLTVGVVSAKGRTSVGINDYEDFIQTDAAINPGNSGGPLVNLDGEVVGINTAIFTRSGGYMGIGFAIPSNLAINIANQLMDSGEVTRGFLGVIIQPLTAELAEAFDIESGKGILISQVNEDSPAEKAGLKEGDVIIKFQDKPVSDVGGFRNLVALTNPKSEVSISVLREGKEKTLKVKVGKLTEDKVAVTTKAQNTDEIGLTVQTITKELAEQFNAKSGEGVVVTAVESDSVAAKAGIRVGSIILQANRKPIKSASQFRKEVDASRKDKRVLLLVKQGEAPLYIALSW